MTGTNLIPLAVPNLTGNERKYLNECIDTGFVSTVGPFVPEFEKRIAAASEVEHCVAISTGTSAIHLALVTAGVQVGDLVLSPAYTFIATANAISHSGALPWLIDSDAETQTMSAQLTRQALSENTERRGSDLIHVKTGRRVSALLPVATLGLAPDLQSFRAIADEFKLPLILDAAAALGAKYRNQAIATIPDLTTYSFNGNKIITSGGGGAIVSSNRALIDRARHLSTTARVGADYDHDEVGYNFRITNIEAAVGCAQIERLSEFLSRKKEIAYRYNAELAPALDATPIPNALWGEGTYWLSGLILPARAGEKIGELCSRLQKSGVGARPFWKPIHLQKPYRDCPQTKMETCEKFWSTVLTLPCSTSLTDSEQTYVISTIIRVYNDLIRDEAAL